MKPQGLGWKIQKHIWKPPTLRIMGWLNTGGELEILEASKAPQNGRVQWFLGAPGFFSPMVFLVGGFNPFENY